MTVQEILQARAAAGARYHAAVNEFINARAELGGFDMAVTNRAIGMSVPGFSGTPVHVEHIHHGEFYRDLDGSSALDWHALFTVGANAILAKLRK
jgi:hypothetical protein